MSEPSITKSTETSREYNGVHRITMEGSVLPAARITRPAHAEGLKTNYFGTEFRLGYEPWLFFRKQVHFRGKWSWDVGYSYIGGDEGNLGSKRHQGSLLTGWKQHLSYFYLHPRIGVGIARNRLNFGEGFAPQTNHSLNGILQLVGGIEFCKDQRVCFAVFGGYAMEKTLSGGPKHIARTGIGGIRLGVDLGVRKR